MSDELPTRRVCLGMPGYGRLTIESGVGLFQASIDAVEARGEKFRLRVDMRYQCGSLLAQNFNALWCWALNESLSGTQVDYFAMLHDDIGPGRGWLDTLITELEERDLDVLGVVVPIKDTQGLTSIALDDPDGDSWRPKCRLTLKEIHALPETFTSDDAGYPLLLNTGCWVCRFNPDWASQVDFSIRDKIRFDAERNKYVAEVEPEDWRFSRLCNGLGLKIAATRKVPIMHRGEHQFSNFEPWGDKSFDSEYVPQSVLSQQVTLAEATEPAAIPLEV